MCSANTPLYNFILAHSVGYYILDALVCNYYGLTDTIMNVHHICVIVGFTGTMAGTHASSDVIEALFLAELTNPFFITRSISEVFAMGKETFIGINNLIFLVMFSVVRGYMANKVMYHYLRCGEASVIFSLVNSVVSVVSSYWLFKMLSMAFNVIFGKNAGNRIIRAGRKALRFLSSNKIGKNIFPATLVLIMGKALQLKYRG